MKRALFLACCVPALLVPLAFAQEQAKQTRTATVTVDVAAEGVPISPTLYGVFFEDINFAADGGLYAELVQNRSFEYYAFHPMGLALGERSWEFDATTAWSEVEEEENDVRARVEKVSPIDARNPNYLQLRLRGEKPAGISNSGYDGIRVHEGSTYNVSLFARWEEGTPAPLRVALEDEEGKVLAETELPAPGDAWEAYKGTLKAQSGVENAKLTITTAGEGRLALDVVSLMPADTFKGRENGLRRDLAQAIADLQPKTLRFPGGCIVHGNGLENAYRWKDTVGPIETRRPNWNRWGYHQTYGLGYFEYMQLAEDIGAQPLPILPIGVSCGFEPPYQVAREDELDEWIDDAIDLVEFSNGPADSEWGKVRAEMGHPEPFNLKYVGLGNEEHDTALFREIFPKFVEAMREAHPEIVLVGTSGLSPRIPAYDLMEQTGVEITDEHYYESPEWFIENQDRFDDFPRGGPKVYVGEYASRGNTLFNAVAEAVYLTGIERNADLVVMTAYAPLLARYDHTQWPDADLIWFDNDELVLTPNYHVQKLFSEAAGERYVPSEITYDSQTPGERDALAVSVTEGGDGTLFVKIVNPSQTPATATVKLEGVDALPETAERTLLSGEPAAKNTREAPEHIAPVTGQIDVGPTFDVDAPAMSVQVIRVKPGGN